MSNGLVNINLRDLTSQWTETADTNQQAIGEGWGIAERFAELHASALQQISRAAGPKPSESDKAVILLGGHGFNLFCAIAGLTVRGQFDVASHLLRGLFDCQALLYATASRDDLARRFMDAKLQASDARKLLIDDLRQAGEAQLAADIEARYLADYNAANSLAHVSSVHGDKLLNVSGGSVTPVLAGRVDEEQCRLHFKAALEQEFWGLSWFEAFRKDALAPEWMTEFECGKKRFSEWMKG